MRTGRKKVVVSGPEVISQQHEAMNRSMKMEQLVMKSIMRLVVAGSVIAIAVNIVMMFG